MYVNRYTHTCLTAPDIWAADVLNKGLKMLNQLWEPVQPRNTPVENPRWFSHCNHRDTVVIKRGLLKQIGPYEINSSHLINLTKSVTNSNVEMKWFDTTEIKVHHALASLLSKYTQYEKVCSFHKSCCSSTVHATWVFAWCLSYQQANTTSPQFFSKWLLSITLQTKKHSTEVCRLSSWITAENC